MKLFLLSIILVLVSCVFATFECDLCEFLIDELDERFVPDMTLDEFMQDFYSLCDEIPTFFAIACKAEADQYGPTIYQFFKDETDPDIICAQLDLCPASVALPSNDDMGCEICEYIVDMIDERFLPGWTEDQFLDELFEICDLLPSIIKTTCNAIVKEDGPQLYEWFQQEEDPDTLCSQLDLCFAMPTIVRAQPSPVNGNYPMCGPCEVFAQWIEDELHPNMTYEEFNELIESFCGIVPSFLTFMCNELDRYYSEDLYNFLHSGGDPQEMCAFVGICPKPTL
ncbi:Saposin like protein [Aduncisulcus paluster]|uniref:Saposin like protein n=1 Tax=Aduncisulcus paluster TaxID=2918883 RepID=A0ABQ5KSZ7_9EUKA|nr:Saposin like protein [Aduncisulcus paluster]|eukprot:gnl/Carplike_NY0171/501_a686_3466.p1 GENE.gnl/Carplike_NY0171/501_a686_3466~~gnl/Carplike_NY0171/501_a686_3466.p1  ORF type:complete len:282 (-),score=77.32 gnl/Carplike_NY0171/501_a686_3466:347-1192(-)